MSVGVCAICGELKLTKAQKRMPVDHCHETEKIRGILCNWCNFLIGSVGDNISLLEKAIDYLKLNGNNIDVGEIQDVNKFSVGSRGMKYLKQEETVCQ